MARCKMCGWPCPEGAEQCVKCGATLSHDVFISYSRRDYVNDKGDVLPNNMLTKIKNLFKANGISYWFDEEGIYSGDEFASVLTKAIRMSRVFLFISSKNSNRSKWTSNEISTALEFKKTIIPFRLDESPYNDSVMMKIVSYDYIDCKDEKKAMSKLLRAVKHHLPSTDSQQRKSIIDVPEGARGATVIFDVGDKRTERVFAYDNGEARIVNEIISEAELKSVPQSLPFGTSGSSWSNLINRKNLLRLTVAMLFLIAFLGGLMALLSGNDNSNSSYTENVLKDGEHNECIAVDLGLPSGTMWADRNVGAVASSDFGELYAWGEISTKKDYSQGMYDSTNKPIDNITNPKYDVATIILGDEWAIPSEVQFKELLNECQWKWIQNGGHNGYEITGKNGNVIFLPAAGWICSSKPDYQNKYGYYWTSERVTSNSQFARSLQFPKDGKGIIGNGYLYYGRSIRAVYNGNAVAE